MSPAAPVSPSASFAPPPSAPQHPEQLDAEVRLLDAARKALKSGTPSEALAALDRHARLSTPSLGAEATLLRVQALLASGRVTEAQTTARHALAGATAPAYAARLSKLAGLPVASAVK